MTLSIERARTRRPITWFTLAGLLLLPAAVGGILVAALHSPTERLDNMTAAIVNLDEPVTINDTYTPLGRALASGLVEGSDDVDSNLNWVISNTEDAAAGLADGTYQAVITIPEEFSAAATSAGKAVADGGGTVEKATIQVTTPDDALVADDLITSQIANVATKTLGDTLSTATTENVLLGFTTIGEQIGTAADGAQKLADGATTAATGAKDLPGGAQKIADGATQLSSGASSLAAGLSTIAQKTRDASSGAGTLASGLTNGADALQANGLVPAELSSAAQGSAQATAGVSSGIATLAPQLTTLSENCETSGAAAEFCAGLQQAAGGAQALVDPAATAAKAAGGTSAGLTTLDQQATATISGQLRDAGTGARTLADGLTQLAGGVDQSTAGAQRLRGGAEELATGAGTLASGSTELVTGLGSLRDGAVTLSDGLKTASDSLPAFSDSESTSIAEAIANPVGSSGSDDTALFGASAIPLLATLALWIGALASFIVLRPYTARVLTSRRSSGALALRAFLPAALLGLGQALLISGIVQLVAGYDSAQWWAFAGTAALASLAFAAVNQALVAIFGGAGRWFSALVGVLAVATGVVSTVPGWLSSIAQALPTAPAFSGLIAANGSAVAALTVWGVLALCTTTLAVARGRSTSAKAVLAVA